MKRSLHAMKLLSLSGGVTDPLSTDTMSSGTHDMVKRNFVTHLLSIE